MEEARLARMIRQKRIKNVSLLRVIRREKELVTREEAKIVRFIKQAGA